MFGPILIGEKVRLMPVTQELLPNYVRWFCDAEVTRYLTGRALTLEMEQEWYTRVSKSENDWVWAIFVGDKHIGSTGIHKIDWLNRRATTGNMIGEKSEWKKGYGSEAAALRTKFAFEELGLHKLQTEVVVENIGSRRALEKTGYVQCGLYKEHVYQGGKWHDMWLAEVHKSAYINQTDAV
jgi:[ribosomal protein S5]-alanine N-acetyltransferase